MRKLASFALILTLMLAMPSSSALAQSKLGQQLQAYETPPRPEMIMYDLIFVRPVSIAACGLGLLGAIVSLPFAAASNSDQVVGQELIKKPFDYTFRRPLGDFGEHYGDH